MTTAAPHADALVFFGATGDLAYKMIFPALQAMIKRGNLDMPVIGVAKAGWTLEQLRERARNSLTEHGGGVDEAAFAKLVAQLQYIDGDYREDATFDQLRKALGAAEHPLHYLAIPSSMFATVAAQLGRSGCAKGARVVIEKPFGRDLATALALNADLLAVFDEKSIFRADKITPGGGNYVRFRLGPDVAIAMGVRSKVPGEGMCGQDVELLAVSKVVGQMGPYERLLGDAMKGDATLFAREDMVESEWRVVDTLLNHNLPVHAYEPGTWGPAEAASVIPGGEWHAPVLNGVADSGHGAPA